MNTTQQQQQNSKSGELLGPWQPTKSRLPVSRVWSLTTRPGPASYTLKGSMGKQPDSTKPKFPMSVFGSEPKNNITMFATYSKGPIYSLAPSMGRQVESNRQTQPKAHFGTSSRSHFEATYNAYTYKPH